MATYRVTPKGRGAVAAMYGRSIEDNPHPADTDEHAQWAEGWGCWDPENKVLKGIPANGQD